MTPNRAPGPALLSLWHRHPLRVHIATVFTAVIFCLLYTSDAADE